MPSQHSSDEATSGPGSSSLGERLLRVLIGVLSVETLAMVAVVVYLTVEQFVDVPMSRVSSLALLGTTVVALALLIATLMGAFKRAPWVRGAAITWQILQLAAAWTVVQGDLAPIIGWVMTALSVIGFVAAFLPAIRTALRARDGDDAGRG